jgi:2-iminobutanoate/2-iminopropanoate deaminase
MKDKFPIESPHTPAAIGPYSPGIKVGRMVFISGQIPVHPKNGQVVGKNVAEQTEVVLRFIKALLDQTEGALANVVKTTVYLTDLSTFDEMNAVYAKHFDYNPPARATVEVSRLPKGVLVEIDAIAMLPERHTDKSASLGL